MIRRLIISPHHDDEILGCGGIMSKYRDDSFYILEVTHGLEVRLRELRTALSLYQNVKDVRFLKRPDASTGEGMTTRDISSLAGDIAEYVKEVDPDFVYIPFTSLHQDHQLINQASMVALRAYTGTILEYEYAEAFSQFNQMEADWLERLNPADVKKKCEAMNCFTTQLKSDRDTNSIKGLATIRGYSAQWPAAEGFRLIRSVK